MNKENNNCHGHSHDHSASLIEELICHLPYAIFSVAVGLIILSFMTVFGLSNVDQNHSHCGGLHALFHSFHFLHIVFATSGSIVMFSRFSNNIVKGFVVSLASALFFCTLSDIILPYLAGRILGVSMHFHICLVSEINNVIPFLGIGLLNGLVMSKHKSSVKGFFSILIHFSHILTSSLASLFYIIAEGYTNWYQNMGLLFILLVIAVVIPCTFADVIVPVFFARSRKGE
ncbi:MAG: hypothetical protein WDZ41_00500 [Candidatus Babeliales bacterium]